MGLLGLFIISLQEILFLMKISDLPNKECLTLVGMSRKCSKEILSISAILKTKTLRRWLMQWSYLHQIFYYQYLSQ